MKILPSVLLFIAVWIACGCSRECAPPYSSISVFMRCDEGYAESRLHSFCQQGAIVLVIMIRFFVNGNVWRWCQDVVTTVHIESDRTSSGWGLPVKPLRKVGFHIEERQTLWKLVHQCFWTIRLRTFNVNRSLLSRQSLVVTEQLSRLPYTVRKTTQKTANPFKANWAVNQFIGLIVSLHTRYDSRKAIYGITAFYARKSSWLTCGGLHLEHWEDEVMIMREC